MKVSKSALVALGVAVVSVTVVALQRSENAKLKHESAELSTRLAEARRVERDSVRAAQRDEVARNVSKGRVGGTVAFAPGTLKDLLVVGDPMERARAIVAYAEGLRLEDIAAAIEELRATTPEWDPDARLLAHLLLARWAREDPDGALASLKDVNLKQGGADATSILAGLAAQDPKRAAEWLGDPENALVQQGWMGHRLAGTIAREWGLQDPDAALAWAESLPEKQRAGAYAGVLGSLAGSDPQRAATLALKLQAGEARRHVVGEIAGVWARSSPKEAAAWAQTLEGEDQRRALRQTLESWAQNEPAEAAKFLESISDPEGSRHYLTTVASNWAQREPPQAAAWVARQGEGDGKNDAMGHVMWHWTNRDPEAAGTWLGEQPEGPARDRGITGLAKAAFEFDRESALNWVLTIGDDETRANSVNIGLREWNRRDPEAAQQWAAKNELEIPADKERDDRK